MFYLVSQDSTELVLIQSERLLMIEILLMFNLMAKNKERDGEKLHRDARLYHIQQNIKKVRKRRTMKQYNPFQGVRWY
jgi:hypothetical protein